MSDRPTDVDVSGVQRSAEALALQANIPVERVAEIYAAERAKLERTARVKNFVGVLAARRTRSILTERIRARP